MNLFIWRYFLSFAPVKWEHEKSSHEWGPDLLSNQLQIKGSCSETPGHPLCHPGSSVILFPLVVEPTDCATLCCVRNTVCYWPAVWSVFKQFLCERNWSKSENLAKALRCEICWVPQQLQMSLFLCVLIVFCTSTWWVWCSEWENYNFIFKKTLICHEDSSRCSNFNAFHSSCVAPRQQNKLLQAQSVVA